MRDHCNHEELWAHKVLDAVRHRLPVAESDIKRALWVLGDLMQ